LSLSGLLMSYDHSTGRVILGVCIKNSSNSESLDGLGAGKPT
jgi:hypothetical protein